MNLASYNELNIYLFNISILIVLFSWLFFSLFYSYILNSYFFNFLELHLSNSKICIVFILKYNIYRCKNSYRY